MCNNELKIIGQIGKTRSKLAHDLRCSMVFSPNNSPLAGREGTQLTGSKIGERLAAEAATSVSLRVVAVDGGGEAFEVQARGELQLGLLIGGPYHHHPSPIPRVLLHILSTMRSSSPPPCTCMMMTAPTS